MIGAHGQLGVEKAFQLFDARCPALFPERVVPDGQAVQDVAIFGGLIAVRFPANVGNAREHANRLGPRSQLPAHLGFNLEHAALAINVLELDILGMRLVERPEV